MENRKQSSWPVSIILFLIIIGTVWYSYAGEKSELQVSASSSSSSSSYEEYIYLGDRGEDVKSLQSELKERGFLSGSVDGVFGKETKEAVKAFQRSANIQVDGIVGKKTIKALEDESIKATTSSKKITAIVTAYCPCVKCCGKTDRITASGKEAKQGRTIAAPKEYPFGTKIIIDGIEYTVEDRGGAIKNNKFDLYFNNHKDALKWGRKTMEITIIYPS